MAPKRGGGNAKKAAARASLDKEWVPSLIGETELNEMVEAGILPDRVTAEWRPTDGGPYPMTHTDELFTILILSYIMLGEPKPFNYLNSHP